MRNDLQVGINKKTACRSKMKVEVKLGKRIKYRFKYIAFPGNMKVKKPGQWGEGRAVGVYGGKRGMSIL